MKQFNFNISKWQDVPDREDPLPLVAEISPTQAEIMLRNNANRAIKINQVNKIRRDIRAGKFKITNDAISFSKEGAVLNGQHRLMAIYQEGIPVKALFGFGFTKEQQEAMDCGQHRSLFDVATLAGVGISREASSIARFVRCQTMVGKVKRQATREEELDFINRHMAKLTETAELLYPKNIKRDQKTGIKIGNDTGAAFFRALVFYSDSPKQLALVYKLARALVYEKEAVKLSSLYDTSNESIEIGQAKVFRLLKGVFDSLNKTRLSGQDQSGRDLRYKKVEKAISLFVNVKDGENEPQVIMKSEGELFKLPEEWA